MVKALNRNISHLLAFLEYILILLVNFKGFVSLA